MKKKVNISSRYEGIIPVPAVLRVLPDELVSMWAHHSSLHSESFLLLLKKAQNLMLRSVN